MGLELDRMKLGQEQQRIDAAAQAGPAAMPVGDQVDVRKQLLAEAVQEAGPEPVIPAEQAAWTQRVNDIFNRKLQLFGLQQSAANPADMIVYG